MGAEGVIMNILINHAMPLLLFISNINQNVKADSIDRLQYQLINKLSEFDSNTVKFGIGERERLAARYCICTCIDEAIHKSHSEIATQWGGQTLLSILHNDTCGGERFYIIIDVILQTPTQYFNLIELCYVLLSLGFEGMYFSNNQHHCEAIRQKLFRIINHKHPKLSRSLSYHRPKTNYSKAILTRKKIYQLCSMGVVTLYTVIFIFYNIIGYKDIHNTIKKLSSLSHESPIITYSQLLNRSVINHD